MRMRGRESVAGVALIALTLTVGCQGGPQNSAPSSVTAREFAKPEAYGKAMSAEAPAAPGASESAAKTPALPRKIVYKAEVELISAKLDETARQIEAKVKELGGYVSGRNVSGTSGESRSGSWTVRIPAEKFDAFLAALPGVGELQSSNTTSEDVSEEFYDAAARLKNKRAEEERLVQLLRTSTGRLTDILTVEKEISRVREEVERIEGRIRFLSQQSDLSTVTINVHEVRGYVPPKRPGFGTEVARSFVGSLDTLGAFVKGLTLALVALLPWLVVLGGLALGGYAILKNLGRKPTK